MALIRGTTLALVVVWGAFFGSHLDSSFLCQHHDFSRIAARTHTLQNVHAVRARRAHRFDRFTFERVLPSFVHGFDFCVPRHLSVVSPYTLRLARNLFLLLSKLLL